MRYPDASETYGYESGAFTLTRYQCNRDSTGAITITPGRPEGSFSGQIKSRDYILQIYSPERPHMISVNGDPLAEAGDKRNPGGPGDWSLQKEGRPVIMINGVAGETVLSIS